MIKKIAKYFSYALMIIVFLGLAELGSRIIYPKQIPEKGLLALQYLEHGISGMDRPPLYEAHPYMSYVLTPNYEAYGFKQTNNIGLRQSKDTQEEKPESTFRILTLGGSTTISYPYVENPDSSWSSQLENMLNDSPGDVTYEVLNGGLSSANSAELLSHYIYKHQYYQPDLIIIHVAINDSSISMFPNYKNDYSHYRKIYSFAKLRRFETHILKSYIVKTFYGWWLKQSDMQSVFGYADLADYSPEEVVKTAKLAEPTAFYTNLNSLITLAKSNGSEVILFPVEMASLDHQAAIEYDRYIYREGRNIAVQKNYDAMQRLSGEFDIKYTRLPEGYITDARYLDHMHLDEEGERLKAQFIYDNIGLNDEN